MNKNKKEKTARIELRTKPSEKAKIQRLAARCNLPVSEYVIKRALGYEPKAVPPDAFFDFYDKLCQLVNSTQDPQTEAVLLELADEMHAAFLLPGKEQNTGTPQSLLCGEKEHPRSCELLPLVAKAKDGV